MDVFDIQVHRVMYGQKTLTA